MMRPLLCLVGFMLAGIAAATEITVTYSFPRVFREDEAVVTALEGSVTATLTADAPVTPATVDPRLEQVNPRTYRTVFAWDDTTPRQFSFLDDGGAALNVMVLPQPALPLNPALHELPVFHLTTTPASLWDPDTGLYVWGLHDNCLQSGSTWERSAQVAVYDTQHQLVVDEPVGLRLNGESSRVFPQKSWRLYFDDYGDSDVVDWDFFGEGPTEFKRLVLKATWIPRYIVSSAMMEPLHRELGHLGSRLTPVAAYVNREYWGLYTLRERLDDEWVEATLDLAHDDYVFIKDGEAEHGDLQEWESLLDLFAPPQAYASHAWYEQARRRLDLTSYTDWLLINAVGATADNGYLNNVATLKVGDGPWRFIMWDEEDLFLASNLPANHLRFYASGDEAEFNQFRPAYWFMGWWSPQSQRWFNIFRGLLQNAEYRAFFAARSQELLDGPLSSASLRARLSSLAADLGPEAARQTVRWGWSGTAFANFVASADQFLAQREGIVRTQRTELLDLYMQPVELSRFAAARTPDGVRLIWRTEREAGNLGWIVRRGVGAAQPLVTVASYADTPALQGRGDSATATSYLWVDASAPADEVVRYQLVHATTEGEQVVHDWLVTVGEPTLADIVVNEVLADNDGVNGDEAGDHDDWLELHNTGTVDVSLAGYTLTDNLENPTRWTLPAVVVPAGGHLLIWCDGETGEGPLHASFSLSADGEAVALFTPAAAGSQLVDSVVFGPQTTDVSFGRRPNGGDTWVFFAEPSPGATNDVAAATPTPATTSLALSARPNPFNPRVTVAFTAPAGALGDVTVYGPDGRRVATLARGPFPGGTVRVAWDGRDAQGRAMPSGTYICRLSADGRSAARKLVLLR